MPFFPSIRKWCGTQILAAESGRLISKVINLTIMKTVCMGNEDGKVTMTMVVNVIILIGHTMRVMMFIGR